MAVAPPSAIACRSGISPPTSAAPCCRSTVTLSKPCAAYCSTVKASGIATQPLIPRLPPPSSRLSSFSRIRASCADHRARRQRSRLLVLRQRHEQRVDVLHLRARLLRIDHV